MPPRSRVSADVSRQREIDAWALASQGRTQRQIAEALGVTQPAVCQILDRIEKRLLAQLEKRQKQEKARQSAILDHLLSEATAAWEKSKETYKASTKRTKKSPVRQSESGALIKLEEELEELLSQVAESRYGDPRFLDVADRLMASKRKLWGLDIAPASQGPGGNPLDKLSPDELERLVQRLEKQIADAKGPA